MEFNQQLKLIRKIEGYTQKKLASLLEIDPTNYQRYEYGKVSSNYKIVKRICNLFPEYSLWLMTGKIGISQIFLK
jgi:DNA-binding XRE family transcriptional regulator